MSVSLASKQSSRGDQDCSMQAVQDSLPSEELKSGQVFCQQALSYTWGAEVKGPDF